MRMSSRTDAENALERLAWTLNFHRGESISINKLANKTGLSWATAQKYTTLLEVLNRIAPRISVGEDGVTVRNVGENLKSLQKQKDLQLLIYLLTHAEIEGGPMEPLEIEEHSDVFRKYPETIEELKQLGWIEHSTSTIKLAPVGVAIAGPARSRVRDSGIEDTPKTEEIQPAVVIDFEEESDKIHGGSGPVAFTSSSRTAPATGTKADYRRVGYRKTPYHG